MSYDIELKDPATRQTIELPTAHIMTGGTYRADYNADTGKFTPSATTEAWLNVTYNYAGYYYDVAEKGIRTIYGKSGAESVPILQDMIDKILAKYKPNGKWLNAKRTRHRFYDSNGKEITQDEYMKAIIHISAKGYKAEDYTITISEGDVTDYWMDTAANALRPLYQLIAMAQLRPDGIWEGD